MSRFIVVAPGSSEAAVLATDELARVLGVATVNALAGTTATDAALRPASALPAAVEAVRAAGEDALIAPAREASNRAFDHVAWNLNLAASTRAGVSPSTPRVPAPSCSPRKSPPPACAPRPLPPPSSP